MNKPSIEEQFGTAASGGAPLSLAKIINFTEKMRSLGVQRVCIPGLYIDFSTAESAAETEVQMQLGSDGEIMDVEQPDTSVATPISNKLKAWYGQGPSPSLKG